MNFINFVSTEAKLLIGKSFFAKNCVTKCDSTLKQGKIRVINMEDDANKFLVFWKSEMSIYCSRRNPKLFSMTEKAHIFLDI